MVKRFLYHGHVLPKQCEKCQRRSTKTIYMKFKTPDGDDTMRSVGYFCLGCGHVSIGLPGGVGGNVSL